MVMVASRGVTGSLSGPVPAPTILVPHEKASPKTAESPPLSADSLYSKLFELKTLISYSDPAARLCSSAALDLVCSASDSAGRACCPAEADSVDFAVP